MLSRVLSQEAAPPPKKPYPYLDVLREDIMRMVPPDGKVIGSIGCGPANMEGALVKQGREVHGVDISPEALGVARTRITSVRLAQPDERVFFEDASLDGLILADVIEHLPRAWEALKIYARAVRPGGWVVISVPNMQGLRVLQTFVWRGEWPEKEQGLFDETHLQVTTYKRLERWANDAGLRLEEWFPYYLSELRYRKFLRLFNRVTFGTFNDYLHFEVQGRFRKA